MITCGGTYLGRYSILRPIMLLAFAYAAKLLVTSVSQMFGASAETADNLGFIAMILAALYAFKRLRRGPNKPK